MLNLEIGEGTMRKVNIIIVKEKLALVTATGLMVALLSGCGAQVASENSFNESNTTSSSSISQNEETIKYENNIEKTFNGGELDNFQIIYKITTQNNGIHEFEVNNVDDFVPVVKLMLELGFTKEEVYNVALEAELLMDRVQFDEFKQSENGQTYVIRNIDVEQGTIVYAYSEQTEDVLQSSTSHEALLSVRKLMVSNMSEEEIFSQSLSLINVCDEIISNKVTSNAQDPIEYDGKTYDLGDFESSIDLIYILNNKNNMNGVIAAVLRYKKGLIGKDELKAAFDNPLDAQEKYIEFKDVCNEIGIGDISSLSAIRVPEGDDKIVYALCQFDGENGRYMIFDIGNMDNKVDYMMNNIETCEEALYLVSLYNDSRDVINKLVNYDIYPLITADMLNIKENASYDIHYNYGRPYSPFFT